MATTLTHRSRTKFARREKNHFALGLDLGTTYTAGVFILLSKATKHLENGKIYTFNRYSGSDTDRKQGTEEIPTLVRYQDRAIKCGFAALSENVIPGTLVENAKLGLIERPEYEYATRKLLHTLKQLRPCRKVARKSEEDSADSDSEGDSDSSDPARLNHMRAEDVIEDFLADTFECWREQLTECGYCEEDEIELHCAVPASWKGGGPLLKLAKAIEKAGNRSQLPLHQEVKFWPEPEAALTYLTEKLAEFCPTIGETVLTIDSGGGTTDLTVYTVLSLEPFRVKEIFAGESIACGSSLLDESFRQYLEIQLEDITYLSQKSKNLSIAAAVQTFRREIKPKFSETGDGEYVRIPGLRENDAKGFKDEFLYVSRTRLRRFFDDLLEPFWNSISRFISNTCETGLILNSIALVGGFSRSPYLQFFIRERLKTMASSLNQSIDLVWPTPSVTSVAEGSLLCAMKNIVGGRRISSCNVGVEFKYPWNGKLPGHPKTKPEPDPWDGKPYVPCLHWLLRKNEPIPEKIDPIKFYRTPTVDMDSITCWVDLVTSEHEVHQDYPCDHDVNKGKFRKWAEISARVDITAIRDKLEIKYPKVRKAKPLQSISQNAPRKSTRIKERKEKCDNVVKHVSSAPNQSPIAQRENALLDAVSSPVDDAVLVECERASATSLDGTHRSEDHNDNRPTGYYTLDLQFEMDFKNMVATWTLSCPQANVSQPAKMSMTPLMAPGLY